MLKVPQQQYIHFLRQMDGCSIQEIAKQTKVNWRTAKKYADRENWNKGFEVHERRFPILGECTEIIDTWLTEDGSLPRKQRQTGTRICSRLKDEHGYTGSLRTVLSYVQYRKEQMKLENAPSYERLEHIGGEAQADFGTHQVVRDGQYLERKVLTLSFPYSNAAFVYPVPSENTECFLEALKHCFKEAGGVPRRIWFDNLSAAVVSVGKEGQRTLTETFTKFCSHYRFEPIFCNPASGNEKGNVENKVGYGRRNWCSPPPVVESDEAFEALLLSSAKEDMDRAHYSKEKKIADLWQEEWPLLLTLPQVPFEVFKLETRKLNKYGEFQHGDGKWYAVLKGKAEQVVTLRLRYKDMDILSSSTGEILATIPRHYVDKVTPIEWLDVVSRWIKRPRSVSHSSFASMLPAFMRVYLQQCEIDVRKSRLVLVKRLLGTYSVQEMEEALAALKQEGNVDVLLEHKLYALRHPMDTIVPFEESHTPTSVIGHNPDLSVYDTVLQVGAR